MRGTEISLKTENWGKIYSTYKCPLANKKLIENQVKQKNENIILFSFQIDDKDKTITVEKNFLSCVVFVWSSGLGKRSVAVEILNVHLQPIRD